MSYAEQEPLSASQLVIERAKQRVESEAAGQKVYPDGVLSILGMDFRTELFNAHRLDWNVRRSHIPEHQTGYGPIPHERLEALYQGAAVTISRAINRSIILEERRLAAEQAIADQAAQNRLIAEQATAALRQQRQAELERALAELENINEQPADQSNVIPLFPQGNQVVFDSQQYASAGQ